MAVKVDIEIKEVLNKPGLICITLFVMGKKIHLRNQLHVYLVIYLFYLLAQRILKNLKIFNFK